MLAPDSQLHNRYRIESLLGEGGMGAVYRAHDETLGVTVAVKENQVVTAAAQRQFEREARLLAGLRHANLPRVTDHFIIPGQGQYLVMDFVEGEDLSKQLARLSRLPEALVLLWARDVLDALAYLHERGIIHRDIKPANIKIGPDGRATLVDFGIAKVAGTGQTTTGARGLTPGYAPPEQYGLGPTDPRTDLYSFGATLYHALTGKVPADAFSRMMRQSTLEPMRQLAPELSAKTVEVVETALAIKAEERWPTAIEMRKALEPDTKPAQIREALQPTIIQPEASQTQVEPVVPLEAAPRPGRTGGPPVPAFTPSADTASRPVTTPRPARRLWIGVGLVSVVGLVGLGLVAVLALLVGSGVLQGPPASRTTQPGVAPAAGDTGRIAFVSDRDGNFEIYLANADGSDPINLTNNPADDARPAFTPDGTRIAFVSNRDGNPDIYLMNADGTGVINMTNNPAGDLYPAWSPDGGTLAFGSNRDGNWEIYLAGQSGVSRLTNQPADDISPSWSHTGGLIAFASERDGNFEIYVVGPDGLQRYTNSPAFEGNPRWSPTQDILAFESDRDGNLEIYVFETSGLRRYTDHPANDYEAAWSGDGSSLAFVSERDGNPEIYTVGPKGLSRITNYPGIDMHPAWQP